MSQNDCPCARELVLQLLKKQGITEESLQLARDMSPPFFLPNVYRHRLAAILCELLVKP